MYVLDALRPQANARYSEFRLLCSGCLYRGNVQTGDWMKSDACRLLLSAPAVLFVVSQPLDCYPQELLLRVSIATVRENRRAKDQLTTLGKIFIPNREVADDLAALFTLFLRRLITVHCHVRTTLEEGDDPWHGLPDLPHPIARARGASTWPRRPLGIITHGDGRRELDDSGPAPVPVDASWLSEVLADLPCMPAAKTIVACARLYSQGMQLIEDRPDIAYQLFIAAAETLASEAFKDYSPTDDEKVAVKRPVYDYARSLNLTDQQARELAIVATKEMFWTARKFQQCLERYTDKRLWEKDDLFLIPEPLLPRATEFSENLKLIYRSRSGALHSGTALPASAAVGTGPYVPVDALYAVMAGERVLPPVTWFERVVQLALVSYVQSQRAAQRAS